MWYKYILFKVLQEQSLDEPQLPKGISPEEELRVLRRKIQERLHAPPVSTTITKIIMKKPYSLECYRSFHEKTELLNEAVYSGNGDAMLAVVLFLVRTLQRKYVVKLLDTHPTALNQFVNYMMVRLQVKECAEWLRYFKLYFRNESKDVNDVFLNFISVCWGSLTNLL